MQALPVRFGVTGATGASATEARALDAIRNIVRQAWRTELMTERTCMASLRVLRVGSSEIDQHRDGIAITSPTVVAARETGALRP